MAESTSEVDICNSALTLLGEDVILDLPDGSTRSILCNQHYHKQRNACLRAYPWAFALKRASFAPLATAPDWGYSAAFAVPSDCLRVWNIEHVSKTDWKREGQTIVTDESTINGLYIAKITDPAQFDSLFIDALAARLAATICVAITAKRPLAADLWNLYKAKIDEAEEIDSQEGEPEAIDDDHSIISDR
jgi:hypothetical protein